MTVFLALLAVLVPASVTLIGYWFKQQAERRLSEEQEQSEKRLAQEQKQSEKRLAQERKQENDRLRLDAAIRAADLFARPSNDGVASASLISL
jgi:F0F1-type ATP synthase membrane subunit b/b'